MKIDEAAQDRFLGQLQRGLDVMSRRQALVASNVTNLETPNYRTTDIEFDKTLRAVLDDRPDGGGMRRTDPRHVGAGHAGDLGRPVTVRDLPVRNDGNNVDLDREMLALAETRGRYEVATTLIRSRLRQLRAAISDGRTA